MAHRQFCSLRHISLSCAAAAALWSSAWAQDPGAQPQAPAQQPSPMQQAPQPPTAQGQQGQPVQPPTSQRPTVRPEELTVAPNAPKAQAVQTQTGPGSGPAIMCRELVAYFETRNKTPVVAGQQGGQPPQPAQTTQAQPTQRSAGTSAPIGQPQGAQAPAVQAPRQTPGAQGAIQEKPPILDTPQQTSGQSAPIPNVTPQDRPTPVGPQQAQAMAQANDLLGCQQAAQTMRRAGVALPPGLIALAALPREVVAQAAAGSNQSPASPQAPQQQPMQAPQQQMLPQPAPQR